MERLKNKLCRFEKAYGALERAIATHAKFIAQAPNLVDPDIADSLMTSVVKNFELAYETGWKFLKQFLSDVYNIEANSPKSVFQTCLKQEILPKYITDQLALLSDTRNLTTHMYDIVIAQEINSDIDQHYAVLGKILELVKLPEEN